MRNLVHQVSSMSSRTIQDKPRLTGATRLRQMERGKFVPNFMKSPKPTPPTAPGFSQKKSCFMDTQLKRRNSRYLSDKPIEEVNSKIRLNQVNKYPKRVMALGVLGSDVKKCPIVFIDANRR